MSYTAVDKVIRRTALRGSARHVIIAIAKCYNDDTGFCFPGRAYLAELAGVSERTVQRDLPKLETSGECQIIRNTGRGHPHEFRLPILDPKWQRPEPSPAPIKGDQRESDCLPLPSPQRETSRPIKGDKYGTERETTCPIKGDNCANSDSRINIENQKSNQGKNKGIKRERAREENAPAKRRKNSLSKTSNLLHPIPENFTVTDSMRNWAATERPEVDIDLVTEKFVNHQRSQATQSAHWDGAWKNWVLMERVTPNPSQKSRANLAIDEYLAKLNKEPRNVTPDTPDPTTLPVE